MPEVGIGAKLGRCFFDGKMSAMVLPPWKRQTYISVRTCKQEYEVADVIRQFEGAYRQRYPVTPQQARGVGGVEGVPDGGVGGAHL